MTTIPLLHFNDVYRVSPQKIGHSGDTVDVTQFAALVEKLRGQWRSREDGKKDGLVLFSGDLFSPSVESSVTRGSHMVPVMNEIGVDIALVGNHDFDFGRVDIISLDFQRSPTQRTPGYPQLTSLVKDSTYPWILSNIIDIRTGKTPAFLHPFQVVERCGVRIGVIGLVEQLVSRDWIATISSWPPEFQFRDMVDTGKVLSRSLRDPDGEHRCDIILALTHCRLPNDVQLAKDLLALSSSGRKSQPITNEHGVDLLLGGHDHLYYISRGVGDWDNYDKTQPVLGAEEDGSVLVLKSGTDFRDLSEIALELENTPEGSIRRKLIKNITGKRHTVEPGMESSAGVVEILKNVLSSVNSAMKAPVCRTTTLLDFRSQNIRIAEAAGANWIADVIRHAYDDALCLQSCEGSDGVLICAGTLRGDSTYGPGREFTVHHTHTSRVELVLGVVTLGDILEILPFDDPVVVQELDGETIWAALEASLAPWPRQEGVTWDSGRSPGQRILSIALLKNAEEHDNESGSAERTVVEEPIPREQGGRKYKIVTRDYLAQGHDGFEVLKGKPYLVDHESGDLMSSIVRKYLLGSQFVNKMSRLTAEQRPNNLSKRTNQAIDDVLKGRNSTTHPHGNEEAAGRWKKAIGAVIDRARFKKHCQDALNVSTVEQMSSVESFDGSALRKGLDVDLITHHKIDESLLVIGPEIDGRLKDIGRERL
ncbi:hypothetical protein NP233_g2848 [Leucocoprinus birnbaumii]|uniref:Metallo-dependent phosphatase n=1 Tax=Leucocoprinus birnbaumii TaxID=56174 RepID=A0AAD5VZZ4_9AGAR|nr:hypothetical protein NP233_g2848 [Leucocoprinus birnbaumii]